MHPEILTENQKSFLPLIGLFKRSYFLVGGTAIALQIGHRRSIDFDLFRNGKINPKRSAIHCGRKKYATTAFLKMMMAIISESKMSSSLSSDSHLTFSIR